MITTRAVTSDDLAAVTDLQRAWDAAWFGVPEHDADEMAELLGRVPPEQTRIAVDDATPAGLAMWSAGESFVTALARSVQAELVAWLTAQPAGSVDVLERDTSQRELLEDRGWRHDHSAFDLVRPVTPDWTLDAPVWPGGVEVRPLREQDAPAVHALIYRDAAWADVPGHPDRPYEEWHRLFGADLDRTDQQVLAWHGDRPVGVATGRTFSDGTGWIAQLAVATTHRGLGLGRALLLEGLRRRAAAGATALGLSVQAANATALALYVGVGLRVDREWMNYRRNA